MKRFSPQLALCFWLVFLLGCVSPPTRSRMERVIVRGDKFVLENSKKPFVPWGMNYGNHGRLMEDFWDTEWETFAEDFRELKALGSNVVRVHLQYGKFMSGPDTANPAATAQLKRMLELAKRTGIYLDITGLACYRPGDTPAWYDAMDTPARWRAQEKFWESVASICAGSPALFCYDLINEPLSPGDKKKQWRSGSKFGGFDFLQNIALDPAGKKPEEVATEWIRRMSAAIRRHDSKTLITVGLLPWSRELKFLGGFIPEKVAPHLDFISVHIYPDAKKLGETMECLQKFAVGKPVVIEETFPLSCSAPQLEEFMRASKKYARGWIGHYDGKTLQELNVLTETGKITLAESIYRDWLNLFVRLKPDFAPEALP
jgi:hypothetical protein